MATEDVVVGDIILIKIGDVVPADARIIEGHVSNLECDEALLTGESLPVAKFSDTLDDPTCPVGDRVNMIYSGSQVTKGRARAIVTTTGMHTELGKIADALGRKEANSAAGFAKFKHKTAVALGLAETTPLQIRLNLLAYILLGAAVVLAIIVVSSTGFKNIPDSIATYAVAAAVSLLPASLVAVVNLTLAVACRDLASRNALVRRMDAVETLYALAYFTSHSAHLSSELAFPTSAQTRRAPSQLGEWFCAKLGFPPSRTMRNVILKSVNFTLSRLEKSEFNHFAELSVDLTYD